MRALLVFPGVIVWLLLPFTVAGQSSSGKKAYSPQFLWGAATSAHQAEGLTGGGVNADWYPFEHTPGNIQNGTQRMSQQTTGTAMLSTFSWRGSWE